MLAVALASSLLSQAPFLVPPPTNYLSGEASFAEGFEATGDYDPACTAPSARFDYDGVNWCGRVTDAAPDNARMMAAWAYPAATTNKTGADYIVRGSSGSFRAVMTSASWVNNTTTFSITIDGTVNTGTEGTAFECNGSDQACADNVANWAEALAGIHGCSTGSTTPCSSFGFTGSASTAYFFPAPEDSPGKIISLIACSTGAAATLTNGTGGVVSLRSAAGSIEIGTGSSALTAGLIATGPGALAVVTNGQASSTNLFSFSAATYVATTTTSSTSIAQLSAANGFTYGNASTFTLTAGTFTGNAVGYVRTEWFKMPWTNAMLVACGAVANCDLTVGTLPAKYLVKRALLHVATQATFAAGTLTMAIGTSAGGTQYVLAGSIKAAADTIYGDTQAEIGASLVGTGSVGLFDNLPSWTATQAVNARIAAGASTVDQVTTSTGELYLQAELLP